MKNAFTLIELILVITIVGILSAVITPRFSNTSLQKAAQQIIFHIRYTQHLAMMDNRFNTDDEWYKSRWQIYFSKNTGSNSLWSYTVFSDYAGSHSGNPDPKEIARNPLNPSEYLSGGTSGTGLIHFNDPSATKELNIGYKFNIANINFHNCGSTAKRIAFDHLGRPITGNLATITSSYQKNRLLKKQCQILLTDNDHATISLYIEPETGYVHL